MSTILSDKTYEEGKSTRTSLTREYKDLSLKFKLHPELGDVRPVKDLEAIKGSIRNILLTRRGERPFKPLLGCNLRHYLFEPADGFTRMSMEEEIRSSLGIQEPRVNVKNVVITDDADNNAYRISIEVVVVGTNRELDIELYLERLR